MDEHENAATKFTENVTILYISIDKEVTANTSQDYRKTP